MKKNILGLFLVFVSSISFANSSSESVPTADMEKADNSQRNEMHTKTAENQSNNKEDLELTRQIRKELTSDKSLSTYARNIKIITENNIVTLKGPVRSREEKDLVLQKARKVAGQAKINDELTVVPKS